VVESDTLKYVRASSLAAMLTPTPARQGLQQGSRSHGRNQKSGSQRRRRGQIG